MKYTEGLVAQEKQCKYKELSPKKTFLSEKRKGIVENLGLTTLYKNLQSY
jgi:hypothetical protein